MYREPDVDDDPAAFSRLEAKLRRVAVETLQSLPSVAQASARLIGQRESWRETRAVVANSDVQLAAVYRSGQLEVNGTGALSETVPKRILHNRLQEKRGHSTRLGL